LQKVTLPLGIKANELDNVVIPNAEDASNVNYLRGTVRPERVMMVELFLQALQDLRGKPILERSHTRDAERARELLRVDAVEWLSSDDESWPFSFVSVCRHLGLDPASVRRALADRRAA
jgi:hypothetical protein